ncbi:Hsp70 family protein [Streptomyces sp. NPDC055722]
MNPGAATRDRLERPKAREARLDASDSGPVTGLAIAAARGSAGPPHVPGVSTHENSYGRGSRNRPRHDQFRDAAWQGGEAAVIPDSAGSRTTPSVVAFTATGEPLVGQLARMQAIPNTKGTIYSAKCFTGCCFDEVPDEAKVDGFDIAPDEHGKARFRIRDKLCAPEEISALVLVADDAGNA